MRTFKVADDVAWTDTADGFAVGRLPHGPLVVLTESSALIWDLLTAQGRSPISADRLTAEVIACVAGEVDPAVLQAHTEQFVSTLLDSGLLVLDQAQ